MYCSSGGGEVARKISSSYYRDTKGVNVLPEYIFFTVHRLSLLQIYYISSQ